MGGILRGRRHAGAEADLPGPGRHDGDSEGAPQENG